MKIPFQQVLNNFRSLLLTCFCNQGNKLSGQLRKTALSLTPQAMYNHFKRPSTETVR